MRTILFAAVLSGRVLAQLPAPNEAGVAMGHLHFNVHDPEASRKFWVEGFGAVPGKLGPIEILKLPDMIVMLRKAEPSGGTEASIIRHVGVKVRSLADASIRWKAAGITAVHNQGQAENQRFVTAPDGVLVEVTEDPSLNVPVANHHIHFYNNAVDETKAWYVKTFGARGGKRGRFEAADVPGVNLTFSEADKTGAATKGRALDHIGFEVRGLEEFCKKLQAAGVKFDVPYRNVPNLGISIAFLTDPWGTYIELTEGLNRL
jgi:catechol 2,3-dioxygenase-like lactoylglutathione lyase family enzyme